MIPTGPAAHLTGASLFLEAGETRLVHPTDQVPGLIGQLIQTGFLSIAKGLVPSILSEVGGQPGQFPAECQMLFRDFPNLISVKHIAKEGFSIVNALFYHPIQPVEFPVVQTNLDFMGSVSHGKKILS